MTLQETDTLLGLLGWRKRGKRNFDSQDKRSRYYYHKQWYGSLAVGYRIDAGWVVRATGHPYYEGRDIYACIALLVSEEGQ
jgi:hypothetical protein